jgi:hypothetical protein
MAEEIKFTDEEVAQINQLRTDVQNVFTRLGQLHIEKRRRIDEIDSLIQGIEEEHSSLQIKEQELFKGLNDKYGDGNYNPETNVFVPSEVDEQKDKE